MKLFRTPETLMRAGVRHAEGRCFLHRQAAQGLRGHDASFTATFGYIDFVAEPSFEPIPNTDKIDLTLTFDEGKQFFVRRIDFSGNATTRDKVIRRELLIDEGDIFNTHLWELSILRLNQLGYFEALKEDEAADIKRDTKDQYRGYHAQGEGARQEFHPVERRRLGHRRQLCRVLVFAPTIFWDWAKH